MSDTTSPRREADELDDIGARLKAIREKLPPDSPLQAVAFRAASLVGKVQAAVASSPERGAGGTEPPNSYAELIARRIASIRESLDANLAQRPRNDLQIAFIAELHMPWLMAEVERLLSARASVAPTGDAPLIEDDAVPQTGWCRLSPALMRAITEPRERDLSVRACAVLSNADLRSLKAVRAFLSEHPDGLLRVRNCGPRIAEFIKARIAPPAPRRETDSEDWYAALVDLADLECLNEDGAKGDDQYSCNRECVTCRARRALESIVVRASSSPERGAGGTPAPPFDASRVDELTEAQAVALHRALIREWPTLTALAPTADAPAEDLRALIEEYAEAFARHRRESEKDLNSWRQYYEDGAKAELDAVRAKMESHLAAARADRELTAADLLAWMRARNGVSWFATIKDVEVAVNAIRAARHSQGGGDG